MVHFHYGALLPISPVGPVSAVVLNTEGDELVDLFNLAVMFAVIHFEIFTVVVVIHRVVMASMVVAEIHVSVNSRCVVMTVKVHADRPFRQAVVVVMTSFVLVDPLADLDGLFAVAIDLNTEVDFVAAEVLWIKRVDRTAVAAGFGIGRCGQSQETSEHT